MPNTNIRTIQFTDAEGMPRVGVVEGDLIRHVEGLQSIYALADDAIRSNRGLTDVILSRAGSCTESYDQIEAEGRLLPPVSHPDGPAHFLVSGTGLTHIGSAATRNANHAGVTDPENPPKSDSMRLFEQGLAGGKPLGEEIGAMPEWFFKGTGTCLVPPGAPLSSPNFARSCAEEPEITGIYLVAPDGTPCRIGYVISNDLSDHETEMLNFMYVAPSKLRDCAMGPELLIGDLPPLVEGKSRILRAGQIIWEGRFESGDEAMSYSVANLEHHHFRHPHFRRPGDLHAHLFGCPVMSFGDGVRTRSGDVFEFDIPEFGRPLRNSVIFEDGSPKPFRVRQL